MDKLIYGFIRFMLRLVKPMHDGLLLLEVESRGVVFDALACLLQMRRQVMVTAHNLHQDPAFQKWSSDWSASHVCEKELAVYFEDAAMIYADGMIRRFISCEEGAQAMRRIVAAGYLNPIRDFQAVIDLAADVPEITQWVRDAEHWIRELIGGPRAATVAVARTGESIWDVGIRRQAVVGDELDTFNRMRSSLIVPDGTDIGEWWETQVAAFPGLTEVARRLRSYPITSTIIERIWSRARAALDYTMGASDPETISKRLFLLINQEIAERVLRAHPELHKAGRSLFA